MCAGWDLSRTYPTSPRQNCDLFPCPRLSSPPSRVVQVSNLTGCKAFLRAWRKHQRKQLRQEATHTLAFPATKGEKATVKSARSRSGALKSSMGSSPLSLQNPPQNKVTPTGFPSKGGFMEGGEVVMPGTTMHTLLTG